jgi:hypothetical protein
MNYYNYYFIDRIEANRGGDKERFSLSPASPRSLQSPIEENDGSPPPTHFKLGDSPWRNLGVEGYARNKGDEDDTLTEKEGTFIIYVNILASYNTTKTVKECDDNDNDPLPRMTGPRDFFMMKRSKNKCKAKFLRNFALDCPTGRVVDEGVKCIGGVLFRPEIGRIQSN